VTVSAMYPGTFDPITLGHEDLVRRACRLFDKVVVAIAANPGKEPMFSIDERVSLAESVLSEFDNVEVRGYDGLTVDFATANDLQVIVRGLRAISDFEYEFQMASTNARLCPTIETMFLTASETNQFIASKLVKEIARLGGDVTSFVSSHVAVKLRDKRKAGRPS